MVKKAAFTLIELIFAIVVIAIAVISLPMMSQITSKGIDSNLKQEAIFAAATELNEIITAHWDENAIENGTLADVINTGGCDYNKTSSRYRLMPGHIAQTNHRKCLTDSSITPSFIQKDNNITTFMDVKHNKEIVFDNPGSDPAKAYKDKYKSNIIISAGTFGGIGNNNIKKITVTIEDSQEKVISSLRTYSANIGEVDYYKRTY